MTVSIVIGTFGNLDEWLPYVERAQASARNQTVLPEEIVHVHATTLAAARNMGAEMAVGRWLIFLDADDELDPAYVESMLVIDGDVRRPATLGIENGKEDNNAVLIPSKNLINGNYIVIGAMIERERFLRLGGFDPNFPILEDWDLWLRFEKDGARIVDVPNAIYRVHVNPNGRNNQNASLHGQIYTQIRSKNR